MLVVFQIPLADLRPFRLGNARRDRPHFPTPDGSEFIRFFGPVRERGQLKQKPLVWPDEQFFVDAGRALSLPPALNNKPRWHCAFRRLLSDGCAVVRFEIGFVNTSLALQNTPLLDAIAALLEQPVLLRGEKQPIKLLLTSKRIARLYSSATTRHGSHLAGNEVVPGQPTVLVQLDQGESVHLPQSLDFDTGNLAFMKSAHSGVTMNLWFTRPGFGEPRATRTVLLRLSAEHQCLKYVLRDISDGNIDLSRGSVETDRLQRYLRSAARTFSRETRFSIDQTDLVRLTQTWETLSGGPELQTLKDKLNDIRPQIREKTLEIVEASNALQPQIPHLGPEFQWRGSFDEIEYQAFFAKPRPPISVKWIAEIATRLSPAVCLISIPAINRTATGFLVAKDLILTNWHVVQKVPTENLSANLAGMQLFFTRSSAPKRPFTLAKSGAQVSGSPIEKYDYALLRVEENVASILGIAPFLTNGKTLPVDHQGINLIQHPGGGDQVISIDENGVSGIYQDVGTVQYISSTKDGSSGSPCLDGDMQLVAIHHAERQRSIGSVREGILMSAIYPHIAHWLL